jgi:DNA-binding MarR family transcriptional regulator
MAPRIDPQDSISCLMSQLAHAMQQEMTSTLAEMNLTLLQLAALGELDKDASLSTADLARLTSVTPQNMSLTVSKLADGGDLIRRPHATNARVIRLEITPKGRRVLRKGIARVVLIEGQAFAGLSARGKVGLRALLRECLGRVKNSHAKKFAIGHRNGRRKR